ncbi:MAG: DUF2156 domain-containing protein [bacterium]
MYPLFPAFKPIELNDKPDITPILAEYQPETSELTFTNLYIWRNHYGILWSKFQDWLLFLYTAQTESKSALPPIGPAPRTDICRKLLTWLHNEQGIANPYIDRADARLVEELQNSPEFQIQPIRDQFDYVYHTADLINLAGDKYHKKKNHLNKFSRSYSFRYEPMQEAYFEPCLQLADTWCLERRCVEDFGLAGEWDAIKDIIHHYPVLQPQLQGAVILIDNQVAAFTFGEILNAQTAVIHIEKVNPKIPELYAVINQQYCARAWQQIPFINREQDLGEPGLRQAKLSYHPIRLVEKYQIQLR